MKITTETKGRLQKHRTIVMSAELVLSGGVALEKRDGTQDFTRKVLVIEPCNVRTERVVIAGRRRDRRGGNEKMVEKDEGADFERVIRA